MKYCDNFGLEFDVIIKFSAFRVREGLKYFKFDSTFNGFISEFCNNDVDRSSLSSSVSTKVQKSHEINIRVIHRHGQTYIYLLFDRNNFDDFVGGTGPINPNSSNLTSPTLYT